VNYFRKLEIKDIIKRALKEDIGKRDISTTAIIPKDKYAQAVLKALENCVICGLSIAAEVFRVQDKNIKFKPRVLDGQKIKKGKIIARIEGNARSILSAERAALNYLCLLCGIATETRKYVNAVRPYKAKIFDTRKTIPGLRELQKYAVKIGGGHNHRMRLDEMILIKDNHIKLINPQSQFPNPKQIPISKSQTTNLKYIIERIREKISNSIRIEVEVKNLREFKEVLKLKPDIIMLDNMSIKDMKKAVSIRNSQTPSAEGGSAYGGKTKHQIPKLEASGGITLKNVKKVASCGVDMISIGALTHSVNSVDISLEIL
jgi:nicotinate-nucleotide pyrophosphorylase (carboxylating)